MGSLVDKARNCCMILYVTKDIWVIFNDSSKNFHAQIFSVALIFYKFP